MKNLALKPYLPKLFLLWPGVALGVNGLWGREILEPHLGPWLAYILVIAFPGILLILTSLLYKEKSILPILIAFLGAAFFGVYGLHGFYEYALTSSLWHLFKEPVGLFYVGAILTPPFALFFVLTSWGTQFFQSKKDISKTHGSADFIAFKDLKHLNQKHGLPVGRFASLKALDPLKKVKELKGRALSKILRLTPDHAVVVAPSGAGKGIGFVIPALLDYKGAVMVTDIKGENYAVTANHRREMGRDVKVFDPFEITKGESISINFMDFLDPSSPSLIDDSAMMAHLLCPTPSFEAGNLKYFTSQGAATIHCFLLYVACSDEVPDHERNLAKVYDLLSQNYESLKNLLTNIYSDKELAYGVAARLAGGLLSTDSRELSGILNSARVELRFLDTPSVRAKTEKGTFKLNEMTEGKTDLYICIPPEKLETHNRLLRLLIGIVFIEMQRVKTKQSKEKLLMLIDEMPALGYMPHIEQALIYGRGYGVSVVAIAQTIELIQSVYPKSWKTFFSSHLALFFGTSDTDTARYLSNALGRRTIETTSENKGEKQKSKTTGETARPLLTEDEIKELGEEVILAFYRGQKPMLLKRLNYLKDPQWKGMFERNPMH